MRKKRILSTLLCVITAACLGLQTPSVSAQAAPSKPARVTSVTATSSAAGKVSVKWKKTPKAKGYQVAYSQDSDFDPKKTVITHSASKSLTNLSQGEKYYIQVRAYDKNGKYGSWSKAKSVTVKQQAPAKTISLSSIPAYSGSPYAAVNKNVPLFSGSDLSSAKSFEKYSSLDSLGRCGAAYACIGEDLMPTEDRGNIGMVKPSGWHTVKYDFVDGKYLYNRCHLIGYQLTAENANTRNLITGTRYMNVEGMLPFENMVADYIHETGNHVLYRVTPMYSGRNLVAAGVLMEAESVEDDGDGIEFCVFVYNVQPGVKINYATGDSSATGSGTSSGKNSGSSASASKPSGSSSKPSGSSSGSSKPSSSGSSSGTSGKGSSSVSHSTGTVYIVNTNTGKFHRSGCRYVSQISSSNRMTFKGSRNELIADGYDPCKVCNP